MITVFSDGSHSPSPDMKTKPLQTKGAVFIEGYGSFSRLGGPGWSDVAEYEGILLGLEKLIELGLQTEIINWYGDNQFVIRFMQQRRSGKPTKDYYFLSTKCVELTKRFKYLYFHWIPREQNKIADEISKI